MMLEPATIGELAEAVRQYNHSAIYPVGAGSWQDLGYPPTKPGVQISTLKLNRVVDYPHEELTITVEAGIRISELSHILAEKGQMLPFDCPYPENATLGGLLATNTSGPRRLAYGAARDSILGLDVVDASGSRIHGGGRVVKNVAGYDLPKMHIGALGTLGIIAEATIKVRPLPEAVALVEIEVSNDCLADVLTAVGRSKLRPVAAELFGPPIESAFNPLLLYFEDVRDGVDNQVDLSMQVAESCSLNASLENEDSTVWQTLTNRLCDTSRTFQVKTVLSPKHVATLFQSLGDRHGLAIQAHALNGVIWTSWDMGRLPLLAIHKVVQKIGGRVSIPRCPSDLKKDLPIWGDPGPEIEWMRRLRNALDPKRVLNPGRFVVD